MTRWMLLAVLAGLFLVVVIAGDSLFIVTQTEQALVLQFGRPVAAIRDPGLHTKVPIIQTVVFFDRRILDFEPPAEEVIASDQKRLVVDSYARYRILDPLKLYQAAGSEENVKPRLEATLNGSLRRVIGGEVLAKLLSPERSQIMAQIRDDVAEEAKPFGIEVIDVRIRRADLPSENSEAIFHRMQSEREREAKEYRAEGAEAGQSIRAEADREVTVIRAEANRKSQILRGEGDAESIKIYADAFGRDPEFFAFYRSLDAYKSALGSDTTLVLPPDSEFLRFLDHKFTPSAKPPG